ncbi:MAG: histidinol-phosphate transaminase [Deltaproteobacteria bacterium]|nr:histidinol-phosphate transaminase [Deltaproteobacteria bacterium]
MTRAKIKPLKLKVSRNIESIIPYPPGKPIEELERELGITGSIKLASNENPLGPSKKALGAVSKCLSGLHRYPDGSCFYLKEKLAKALGVDQSMLIFGNGSNEIIELLIRAFLTKGDEALMADPSFAVYPIVVKTVGAKATLVPLIEMRHDLKAMSGYINKKTRIIFIANPNNPTGTIVTQKEFDRFMKSVPKDVIVCVDEAYYEFVRSREYPDTMPYVKSGRPVVILRTFSKIYGLAGLRIGYGIAHPGLVGYLNRVRQPFNVNSLAQAAAMAALDDRAHLKKTRDNTIAGLKYLYKEIGRLGFECVKTEANFFLVKVGDGRGTYDALLKKGVIVRPMASYNLPEYIRVTVGLPEENERFVKTFSEIVR